MIDNNVRFIEELNLNSLRNTLKRLKTASVGELSHLCGLENSIAEELSERLCTCGEFEKQNNGNYSFNSKFKLALTICVLEKNKVAAAVSDLDCEYLEKNEIDAHPETLEFFDGLIKEYLEKYPSISVLAFAMAGFEVAGKGLFMAIDFPDIKTDFRRFFLEKYKLPCILENDIKAAVLGHYQNHYFGKNRCVAALYMPQTHRSGSAACINGRIYRGRDNIAGEVIFLDTPFRWKPFSSNNDIIDFSKINIPKYIADLAVPQIVFLNPHRLVIYGNWLPDNIEEEVRGLLAESIPREFLPKLVFIPDVLPDVLDGLSHRALKMLKPRVKFINNS